MLDFSELLLTAQTVPYRTTRPEVHLRLAGFRKANPHHSSASCPSSDS